MTAAQNLSNPELDARLWKDPDDLSSYLVYSDWLSERGDPRGELIAVQAKLRDVRGETVSLSAPKRYVAPATIELDLDPKRKLSEPPRAPETPETVMRAALEAQEKALLEANKTAWLGTTLAELEDEKDLSFTWRLGFIDGLRFGPALHVYDTTELAFPEAWEEIMKLPHLAFVREVVIGSRVSDDYPASWSDILETMAEKGMPDRIERLVLDCGGYWDISNTALGDLAPLYSKLSSSLRELRIRFGSMDLGETIDLPLLRSLEIETGGLTDTELKAISASKWPNLESLSISMGDSGGDYGCSVTFENILPILEGTNLEAVRHLGLCNTNYADQIAAELPRSKILRRLKTLDLSNGTLSDEGARALINDADAFQHLEKIKLEHHYVGPDLEAQLKLTFGAKLEIADSQYSADDAADQTYDYRYCATGE